MQRNGKAEDPDVQSFRNYKGVSRQGIRLAFLEEGGYFDLPIKVSPAATASLAPASPASPAAADADAGADVAVAAAIVSPMGALDQHSIYADCSARLAQTYCLAKSG